MKSKSTLFVFALSAISVLSFAQTKPAPQQPASAQNSPTMASQATEEIPFELKVYDKAMLFGDLQVAKNEIFQLIAKNPEKLNYMDSLARIYFSLNAYPQSLLAAKIVLDKDPKNLAMMELSAISYDALGSKKEALEQYEKLYPLTQSLNHQYQIAVLQYSLQRFGECSTTTDALLANPQTEKEKININVDQNNSQEVSLKAAVFNLRGVLFKEMNQPDKAKVEFESALKLNPDFALAKSNLEMMNKPPEPKKEEKKK